MAVNMYQHAVLTYEAVPAGAQARRGRRAGRSQRAERAAAAAQRAALQRACNTHIFRSAFHAYLDPIYFFLTYSVRDKKTLKSDLKIAQQYASFKKYH